MPTPQGQIAPEAPAAAGTSQGASDPFAGAMLPGNEDPTGAVATDAPAPADEGTPAETTVPEGQEPPAEQPEPEVPEVGTEGTAPKPEARVWAGEYKTPDELETAHKELVTRYDYSSKEGRRLNAELKEQAAATGKAISDVQTENAELKAIIEAGPEIEEPTDEALEAMGNIKATRLLNKIAERKATLSKIRETQAVRTKEQTQKSEKLVADIVSMAQAMPNAKTTTGEPMFPDYHALLEDIDSLMQYEPGVTGHAKSPVVLYFAAYGRRALERDRKAKTLTKNSTDLAARKAKAAAVGADAAGASGGGAVTSAKTGKQPAPDSDEAYNRDFLAAHRSRHVNPLR